jgi:hypothetical protein
MQDGQGHFDFPELLRDLGQAAMIAGRFGPILEPKQFVEASRIFGNTEKTHVSERQNNSQAAACGINRVRCGCRVS